MTGADRLQVVGSHILEFEVDGDVSLYPGDGEQALVLNRTASDIWRLLARPTTVAEVVTELAERYERSPGEIQPDVQAVIDTLLSHGVIETVPPGTV